MIRKNSIQVKIATLFAIVFVGTLLAKPVHLFFPHHDHHCNSATEHSASNSKHEDCSICHFSFSAFTTQKLTDLRIIIDRPYTKIIEKEVVLSFSRTLTNISLRAPPAL